jgi:biopolymer transport protein ExbD
MHEAANGAERFEEHDESFGTIVADLMSLVEHVQASISLIEIEIAQATTIGDRESSRENLQENLQENAQENSNVIVLDDVTPQYMRASIALNTCRTSLGTALHILLENRMSAHPAVRLSAHG